MESNLHRLTSSHAAIGRCARWFSIAVVAAVPVGCGLILDHSLREAGWPVWESPVYISVVVSALVGAWFWARHFVRGVPRLSVALALLGIALVWIAVRTDWIVETDYEFMDDHARNSFTPPSSPLWHPPRPQDLSNTATSWRHWDFFYMGGAGGPTEEPQLHINWPIAALKVSLITIPGYLFALLLIRVFASFRRRKSDAVSL